MRKGITFLPSKVMVCSGKEIIMSELTTYEHDDTVAKICEQLSRKMSDYFSNNKEEWNSFVNTIKSSE